MEKKNHSVKRHFITGLIVILPFFLTAYIIWFLFKMVGLFLTPAIAKIFHVLMVFSVPGFAVSFISALITLFLIWLAGVIASNFIGEKFFSFLENVLLKIPMARGIYEAISKLTDIFLSNGPGFKRVVIVEWPRKGVYSLAFITSDAVEDVRKVTSDDVVNVFLPSTPNPTTGFLVMLPRSEIIPLDMSVDDAVRLIISGGIVSPSAQAQQRNGTVGQEPGSRQQPAKNL